jgi:hypothetical protein
LKNYLFSFFTSFAIFEIGLKTKTKKTLLTVKFFGSVVEHFDEVGGLGFDPLGVLVLGDAPQLPLHLLGAAGQTPGAYLELRPWKTNKEI